MEDNKKMRLQLEKNETKGKEVLTMNKPTKQLNATDLEKLLLWNNVPKKELGNKNKKLEKWTEIQNSNQLPPLFQQWGHADKDFKKK